MCSCGLGGVLLLVVFVFMFFLVFLIFCGGEDFGRDRVYVDNTVD